ncbi:uncharacterized protein LOC143283054 isoform X2 [Babylonia areolata]|uniref:uncharacterized protein LOC143283054 isoform X2 n=1 Tax=Babylonia areolata TaxID=304850 RepID=UPI003FCFEE79
MEAFHSCHMDIRASKDGAAAAVVMGYKERAGGDNCVMSWAQTGDCTPPPWVLTPPLLCTLIWRKWVVGGGVGPV